MTVTASSSNFTRAIYSADATPDLALPTTVPAGATIVVGVKNRSDATTDCTGVTDSNGATYTKASESTATTDTALWYTNNSAGGTVTVTVTWASAINSQVAAGWISSDAGAMTADGVATVREAGGAETDVHSNTVTTTGAGCIVGFMGMNNAQADPEPTADGAGESELLAGLSGLRVAMFFEATPSAGTYGFEATVDSAITHFHVLALKEGASLTKKLKLLAHSSAVGATGCTVEVFAEPSAGDLTGTKFGKATSQSWSAGTGGDAGFAVMKIPVADFSGSALAVNDTPVALVENTTNQAARLADPFSIVIEE